MLGDPIFKKHPDFKQMLASFVSDNCKGYRNEQCKLFKDCGIRLCHQEKQVDFCHQCDEFPCNNTGFDENLQKIWVLINEKIKKMGMDQYCEKTKNHARYV